MCITRILFIQNDLRYAVTIAEVDKCQNTKVALFGNPSHQHHVLADIADAKLTASVRPFQISQYI
jgi:hypothetical protein